MYLVPFIITTTLLVLVVALWVLRRVQTTRALTYSFSNNEYCRDHLCLFRSEFSDNDFKVVHRFKDYSPRTAYYCLNVINRVYDADYTSNLVPPPGFEVVATIANPLDKNRSIGYVMAQSDILWVVFRGTKYVGDILQDLNMTQSRFREDGVLVHTGFLGIYQAARVKETVERVLTSRRDRFRTLLVTGHSLGGAMSMLTLYDLSSAYGDSYDVVCYTFGCPRVGNTAFTDRLKHYKNICYRIANSDDIVPNIPLSITMNFLRPHHPFFYNHYGRLFSFSDNLLNYEYNHVIQTYIANLWKIVQETIPGSTAFKSDY
jgi:hypothetical protein